uniref:VPS37A subunit of ESCRT-I n=1 Tax=Gadus morhua TaxID=8049 RepID=A0A8C5B392_GADMO
MPALSGLQQQRQRQIESLRTAHSSLTEIQKDVEYRIPFTVNNSTISVNILLPPQFPQEKPVVSVYPPVGHHLVDSNNGTMVTSPLLTNFGMHSDLGKVVQSLLDEFWKSPPALMTDGNGSFPYPRYQPSLPVLGTRGSYQRPVTSPRYQPSVPALVTSPRYQRLVPEARYQPSVPDLGTRGPLPDRGTRQSLLIVLQAGVNGHMYKMPDIPEIFPELSDLSVSQLKQLSEEEDVLLSFFVTLPQLKLVSSDKEDLVSSIVAVAKKNLQMEPQLEGKRQEMLYKYDQLTQMKMAFETKLQRQHELSESCSVSALQARVKVSAHQAEEESEETADHFLEGRSDIDDFLSSFMEKRTLCHSRRAKEEKLQQSINTHGPFPTSI